MAVLEQNPFQDLYDYSTSTGIVIPQTSSVKAMVEQAFSTVFGSEVNHDATTPMGRFIEAITMLIVNVLGVNAQNANMMNPKYAVGNALDSIGAIFNITRPEGMSDAEYRKLILRGQSNGVGFAESIQRAVMAVEGVRSAIVLNNGLADPSMEPRDEAYSVQVEPHSVAVSVRSDGLEATLDEIASAINDTISLGCGMTCEDENIGGEVQRTIGGKEITFYVPNNEISGLSYSISISPDGYSGDNIYDDARAVVRDFLYKYNVPGALTPSELVAYITNSGIGVVCRDASILRNGISVSSIILNPSDFIDTNPADGSIEVNVL